MDDFSLTRTLHTYAQNAVWSSLEISHAKLYFPAMANNTTNPYYQGPVSGHFDGTRFFTPQNIGSKSLASLLKWRFSSKKQKWPNRLKNPIRTKPKKRHDTDNFSVTFIGHATILLQICGLNIITDPFFSDRASPLKLIGPKRARPPGLALKDLPPIDYVLLSHNHYDHLDLASLKQLHDLFEPVIITPLGNGAIVAKTGRAHQIAEADWAETIALNTLLSVTLTPALHWSKRSLKDRNMALWAAFLLQTPFGPIYFAADTGYGNGDHFRAIQEEFGPVTLSFLPIGAYEPRWFMKPQHMNPNDAVKAHMDLASRQSVAIHHGTIQLTDEAIDTPVKDLQSALQDNAVDPARFHVLECGQSRIYT